MGTYVLTFEHQHCQDMILSKRQKKTHKDWWVKEEATLHANTDEEAIEKAKQFIEENDGVRKCPYRIRDCGNKGRHRLLYVELLVSIAGDNADDVIEELRPVEE